MASAWTKADLKDLKRMWPSHSAKEIADLLGRSYECVKKKASRMGLRKGKRYLQSLGRKV